MDCRIRLAQVEPTLGNLEKNLRDHEAEIRAAIGVVEQTALYLDENVQPRLALEAMALALPRGAGR